MSRSKRKSPIIGVTSATTEKQDKRSYNRSYRHKVKRAIHAGKELLPNLNEVATTWDLAKDGKRRFDPQEEPRLMRK